MRQSVFQRRFLYNTSHLAHLLWEQGVVGSNPATPTKIEKSLANRLRIFLQTHGKPQYIARLVEKRQQSKKSFPAAQPNCPQRVNFSGFYFDFSDFRLIFVRS